MAEKKIKNYSLWKKYKEEGDQQARKELILSNLSLVKYQAGRINLLVPDFIDREDLESFGVVGLIDAVEKFDYNKGVQFNTYGSIRVRGAIMDYLRKLDWLPSSTRRCGKEIKKTAEKMASRLGRPPRIDELAEKLDYSVARVRKIYQKIYSADWLSLYRDIGDGQLNDILPGDSKLEPENIVTGNEAETVLAAALEKLTEKQYLVISLYYYEEMTQQEISEIMEVSPARISQIHKKAVYRLRGFLSSKKEQLVGSN